MSKPTIIFIGTRRTPLEVNAAVLGAHAAGYKVALLGPTPPAFCREAISDFEQVDIFDRPAALKAGLTLAHRTKASGVVTWTDTGVELAAALAQRCGWPGVPPEAAHKARNKHSMRSALLEHPELIPRFRKVDDLADLEAAAAEIGTPAVLKPAGGSGSRSIFQIDAETDLAATFRRATLLATRELSPVFGDYEGQFVYEERLGGSEHSVEGFVHDGRTMIAGITDKWVTEPFYVEYEQVHPTALSPQAQDSVRHLARSVTRAIGLDWCSFHLECRVLPDGSAKLLEIAARPGGGYITSHLIPLSTGIPFPANLVRVATGQAPDMEKRSDLFAASRGVLSPVEGQFHGFDGLYDVLELFGLEHFVHERELGGTIVLPPGETLSAVLGYAITRSVDYQDARDVAARAIDLSRPRITTT
ncbi:acetyl-CoA carboxylase biotin carboxylase subunit family protein [Kitasatospora sp. NPDC059599]|uniref:ATP-grasp domain-containing protein n=1 Tax=Kitasatospora sp. NPDC059599 TaxID=3346880 RepID=UPI0036BEE63D